MNRHYVVIGANYGDEGKGQMTDYLCSEHNIHNTMRFNGGSQAGHTVEAEGKRIVFNLFGSGSIFGAKSWLGPKVVLNPMAIVGEALKLIQAGVDIDPIHVESTNMVSSPMDTWINQQVELKRSGGRHGSCGLGINETITRCVSNPLFNTSLSRYFQAQEVKGEELLRRSMREWFDHRLKTLELDASGYDFDDNFDFWLEFIPQLKRMLTIETSMLFGPGEIEANESCVFEGAQGLALDEQLGIFPHVTRSITGSLHAFDMIEESSDITEVVYVTRTYLTRHGAGPLEHEMSPVEVCCGSYVADRTNIENPWQGKLRYAPLHVPQLQRRILADIGRSTLNSGRSFACLALTHLDIPNVLVIWRDGEAPKRCRPVDLIGRLGEIGLPVKYASTGPTRDDVRLAYKHRGR